MKAITKETSKMPTAGTTFRKGATTGSIATLNQRCNFDTGDPGWSGNHDRRAQTSIINRYSIPSV